MKVSVLMAVYNGIDFLQQAVNSILQQTHGNLEFIVVDDGSTDGGGSFLKEIRDERLKVICQDNHGLAAALNRGLAECTSEFVVRMDADDISYPERIEILLQEWDAHGRPDVFGSNVDFITSSGRYLWTSKVPTEHQVIKSQTLAGIVGIVIHPSVMLRKEAVMADGGYDASFRKNGQDFDLWLRMCERCQFGNTARALMQYRFSANQSTGKLVSGGGPWAQLLALQKKRLADSGFADLWESERGRIESILWERFLKGGFRDRAMIRRTMTELKIAYRSGNSISAIAVAARLGCSRPVAVMKVLADRLRKTPALASIVLDARDLNDQNLLAETPR